MMRLDDALDIRQIALEHRVFTLNHQTDYADRVTFLSSITCECGAKFRSTGKAQGESDRRVFKVHALHVGQAVSQFMAEAEAGTVTL